MSYIHIDTTALNEGVEPKTVDELAVMADKPCPRCGCALEGSFGLMGGGYGMLLMCAGKEADENGLGGKPHCGYIAKHNEPVEESE